MPMTLKQVYITRFKLHLDNMVKVGRYLTGAAIEAIYFAVGLYDR